MFKIFVVLVAIVLLFILGKGYFDKKKTREKDSETIVDLGIVVENLLAKVNLLESEKRDLEKNLENLHDSKEILEGRYQERKRELEEEYLTSALEKKEQEKILEEEFKDKRELIEKDKEKLEAEITELKERYSLSVDALKNEAEKRNELTFHKISFAKESIEDIEALKEVEKLIHNKEVLRKLIYKTYVERPMNDLFNRIGIEQEPGIYKIQNTLDGKTYIGQSVNVRNRLREHIKSATGTSNIAHQAVHDAMAEEGLENFTFHLIETCERELLNEKEKYWIDFYESNVWGYNRTRGGS